MALRGWRIYAWGMNLELFSDAWAERWCAALNASAGYRTAAGDWDGVVALVMTADGDASLRAAVLHAAGGACQMARSATADDLARATYVFEGAPSAWREVFGGRIAPAVALLTGKLKLARGSLASLMPHAAAAREMIAAAAAVSAESP